jgi:hypothetical protein
VAHVYYGRETIKTVNDAPMLGIGLPCRNTGPVEFYISLFQALPPLNVKTAYIVQKGMLPAAARNAIVETALEKGMRFVLFLDDDVLFPDVTMYRLWGLMQLHPEAAVISAVVPTKLTPCEPLLYDAMGNGAFWDWTMGCLVPIHSAGAGCMIVDLAYVAKLSPPWFQDATMSYTDKDGIRTKETLGQDRYFMARVREEGGGVVYADTGLILGHMDTHTGLISVLPPEAPCYNRTPEGESFVPGITDEGVIMWTRYLPRDGNPQFRGYLRWLAETTEQGFKDVLIKETPIAEPSVPSVSDPDDSVAEPGSPTAS